MLAAHPFRVAKLTVSWAMSSLFPCKTRVWIASRFSFMLPITHVLNPASLWDPFLVEPLGTCVFLVWRRMDFVSTCVHHNRGKPSLLSRGASLARSPMHADQVLITVFLPPIWAPTVAPFMCLTTLLFQFTRRHPTTRLCSLTTLSIRVPPQTMTAPEESSRGILKEMLAEA